MTNRISVVLPNGHSCLEMEVEEQLQNQYNGRVIVRQLPQDVADAIAEYTRLVEEQVLSQLDAARSRILSFGLRVRVPGAPQFVAITELQLYGDGGATVEIERGAPSTQ